MRLMTDSELAEHLQLPLSVMHELRRRHSWPCVKLGRFHYRFTEGQVAQIIERHTITADQEPVAVSRHGQTPRSAAYAGRKRRTL